MSKIVTAGDIDAVLVQWGAGQSSAKDVHNWAEYRFSTYDWEPESDVVNEVLAHLDKLNMNLVVIGDIPLLREALLAQSPEAAAQIIDRSYVVTPIDLRKHQCTSDPFYARFCN